MPAAVRVIEVLVPAGLTWTDAAHFAKNEALRSLNGVTDLWLSGMHTVGDSTGTGRFRLAADVSYVVDPVE
jgi:hypothetical protein